MTSKTSISVRKLAGSPRVTGSVIFLSGWTYIPLTPRKAAEGMRWILGICIFSNAREDSRLMMDPLAYIILLTLMLLIVRERNVGGRPSLSSGRVAGWSPTSTTRGMLAQRENLGPSGGDWTAKTCRAA